MEAGLIHEKYHFNIVELYARKIRKDLQEKKVFIESNNFQTYVDSVWNQVEVMQSKYDSSNFSRISDEQIKWQEKIDLQLDSLKNYESILIDSH